MKRIISVMLILLIALSVAGCGATAPKSGKIRIITTIFPEYDWVNNIVGERTDVFDVTLLQSSGVDMHSYQPTAADIINISTCDMFVYVGGESDKWVNDALKNVKNKEMTVVNLMEVLGSAVKTEETKEGMEAEEEEEEGVDEHVWLSVRNASTVCRYLGEKIKELDPDNAVYYSENVTTYCSKLAILDTQLSDAAGKVRGGTLVFADRFPFRYLASDYGLDYFAAFPGCSAETEASFNTVLFLAKKVDELGLKYVLTIDGTTNSIASSVIDATAAKTAETLKMNSMQSVTAADIDYGVSYVSLMQKNVEALRKLAD